MKIVKSVGGLGSQMMAFGLFLALKKKFGNAIYYVGWFKKNKQHNGLEVYKVFGIDKKNEKLLSKVLNSSYIFYQVARRLFSKKILKGQKQKFNFDPQVLDDEKIIFYDQCWTSYKYFESVEDEIKKTFVFPELVGSKNKVISDEIRLTNSVSVHVRRGDYLNSPILGGMVGPSYYRESIKLIYKTTEYPIFYIFSDDIEWCKSELDVAEKDCRYIDWNKGKLSFQDMCLMSLCKHNVIANSSFSWWPAYLNINEDKIVICPKYWAKEGSGIEFRDINCPDWIEIDNSIA